MVELVFQRAQYKLSGLNDSDIEHYHRIRNQLYHNGTGLGVDRRYLVAYRQIAAILLDNLFDIKAVSKEAEATLAVVTVDKNNHAKDLPPAYEEVANLSVKLEPVHKELKKQEAAEPKEASA